MRIIAGKYRGLQICAPKGRDVRPTTNRVREAMFSSVGSCIDLTDTYVLDAFAGSGALGVEALSRGASYAVFCEQNHNTIKVLKRNFETINLHCNQYRLMQSDVYKVSFESSKAFNIVFLDPPYATSPDNVMFLLDKWDRQGVLAEGCVVVYEHSDINFCLASSKFKLLKTKKYGKIIISYLRLGE